MTDADTDGQFESSLTERFETEYDIDAALATDAAAKAAAFRADFESNLTADAVLDAIADAPYDGFEHRFDRAIGTLAGENEDCTDSRPYRMAGYGDLAADPDQGS